jgi:RNA binding exosome subunit
VIHRVSFRTFVAATEDEDRVKEALSIFVPLDSITVAPAEGHYGNQIKILDATLKKKDGLAFFRILKEQMAIEDLIRLERELPQRIDKSCQLRFRLDKQVAFQGRICLTDDRDAIAVTALIESYPAKYEDALRIAGELL